MRVFLILFRMSRFFQCRLASATISTAGGSTTENNPPSTETPPLSRFRYPSEVQIALETFPFSQIPLIIP